MPDEARVAVAFCLAALLALATVPIARRVALRTGFVDHPIDYKAHLAVTPYLGGAGVMAAFAIAAGAFGSALGSFALVLSLAFGLMALGTIDDKRQLGPGVRFGVQLLAGVLLWVGDIRWEVLGTAWLDLPITLIWVAGLTNAFNLLDNIDGATGTTASVSAAGIGVIALLQGDAALGAVAFALSGACAAFLVFNLAKPSRIFLGDGGSLPIGFLIAALAMLIPTSLGQEALLAAVPLGGIAIFDTTLVVLSRTRKGITVLTGGRDHSTHRLLGRLGSARAVCALLAVVQGALCALAAVMQDLPDTAVVAVSVGYLVLASILLVAFERPFARPPKAAAEPSA